MKASRNTSFFIIFVIMIEEWKELIDYPNYEISSHGRCRNKIKGNILKPNLQRYIKYGLSLGKKYHMKTISIHRYVALYFIPNPENKETVNHIDGNKHNNHVTNLEWNTYKENVNHSWKNGLSKPCTNGKTIKRGIDNGMSKLTDIDILDIRERLKNNELGSNIARLYKISENTISHIKYNRIWKHIH